MTLVKESQDVYFSSFSRLEEKLVGKEPSWVTSIRTGAFDRFAELGFPTTHNEEWKYTSVAPIASLSFLPARYVFNASIAARLKRLPFADLECNRLVFINGTYCPGLSSLGDLPAVVTAGNLGAVLALGNVSLEQHLARHAKYEDHAFVALNTAFMEDGAFIEIPKDVVLEKPIYLLFISTANGQPTVVHPRNLILIGWGSQVSFIEAYLGLDVGADGVRPGSMVAAVTAPASRPGGVYFTNAVTELVAGEGAVVDYCKVQEENERAFHVATLQVHQARSSSVTTHSIAFGGRLVREEVKTVLDGEGAECLLNGLYVINGQQHVDNHTTIDHAKPHCGSRELYKGVLDGHSTAVFNGKIMVRKDAQKTDSKQSNKNLLLSENAVINTKPQLEIYADDVKCTHGATIGQIDPDAVFYIRSRGIALEEARKLLVQAFANDLIARIKFEPLRAQLNKALLARLAKGQQGP